ncbi:5-(carboxyamino)imidazole ribonucleotide mutase [Pseudothermotoga thermarum]|uniref:N5-carboxyaminoimidazole ribonucleotide mutase n=1 Tax=Pseudothermotoga thermarum DSM 5069 TaxID=688269 RepID=F7YWV5_9THEM|nr:5-(carboxyamino)imidazole ribonucleotide mutase [Pseudothermotoga thermarum]AEH50547.1 phosphoribosylaminoimidazole carboxylase, catalytic subunit [Pseudothermotoga thermarum DSM 5069]
MKIAVVVGSEDDLKALQEAFDILKDFSVAYDVFVLPAHKATQEIFELAKNVEANGYEVVIVAAGTLAYLPALVAANTSLPVIGVPIASFSLSGLNVLFSASQMPPEIPVATVAINNVKNAALLAVEILALKDQHLRAKLLQYRDEMKKSVLEKNKELFEKE